MHPEIEPGLDIDIEIPDLWVLDSRQANEGLGEEPNLGQIIDLLEPSG